MDVKVDCSLCGKQHEAPSCLAAGIKDTPLYRSLEALGANVSFESQEVKNAVDIEDLRSRVEFLESVKVLSLGPNDTVVFKLADVDEVSLPEMANRLKHYLGVKVLIIGKDDDVEVLKGDGT